MADLTTMNAQQLFKQWRDGDGDAGQAMAQRFSDWYYAVTAARLGDQNGRGPLQRACTRFQQGITGVTDPKDLADWAHRIVAEEISMAGGRIVGGDFPSLLTAGRSPTDILKEARNRLGADQVRMLSHAYDSSFPIEQVTSECESMGGYPYAVLRARYDLKRLLRESFGIAFSEVPAEPNLDNGPLPLYEAGRMANSNEEAGFEKWLLTNMPLCKDIAEFGVFALALRAGAFAGVPMAAAPPAAAPPAASPTPTPTPTAPAGPPRVASTLDDDPFREPETASSKIGVAVVVVVGGGLVIGFLVLVGLTAWKFLG